MPEQSKEPRLSLKEWQDEIAKNIKTSGTKTAFYENFEQLKKKEPNFVATKVQLEALQAYHLQEVEALKSEIPKWISVEERLPEYNQLVLCIGIGHTPSVAKYINGKFIRYIDDVLDEKFHVVEYIEIKKFMLLPK